MSNDREARNWWRTLPGVITTLTALVTAVGGFAVAIKQTGWLGSSPTSVATAPVQAGQVNQPSTAEARYQAPASRTSPGGARSAPCDALVGSWAWFIGGDVTVKPDGTFVQQSGNAGAWQCTDPSRRVFTMRWRDGGYINTVIVSENGLGLSSADPSQAYVTARRAGTPPGP